MCSPDLEGWISFYYQKRSSKGFSVTDGMADGKRKLNVKQLWIKTINPQNSYVLMQGSLAKNTAIWLTSVRTASSPLSNKSRPNVWKKQKPLKHPIYCFLKKQSVLYAER